MSATATTYTPISRPPSGPAEHSGRIALAHLPWMAAVLVAPFCFGAVRPEVQAALALPIALSLFWNGTRLRPIPGSPVARAGLFLLLVTVLLSLVPLPESILRQLSPEAARLSGRFASDPVLTLSRADTVLRFWQLALIGAVFVLAREAASISRLTGIFSCVLALALLGLAATEFWLLIDGRGIWREVRHYPAGTFANRNHFANWMAVGAMLLFGALLRKVRHFRKGERKQWLHAGLLGAGLLGAIAATIACGSRGGMLGLSAGLFFWVVVLFRQRAKGAAVAVLGIALVGGATAFGIWGELFMARLTQDALSFKWRIWEDAMAMAVKFPLFGVGLGAFEPAFGIFKRFHGEGTFLFAENEYVQWVVELGLAGAFVAVLMGWALAKNFLRRVPSGHLAKADFYHGALAGLTVFAVHASVEFVGQVMANALLAAVLLGLAWGLKERAVGPTVAVAPGKMQCGATLLLGLLVLGIATPQVLAAVQWRGQTVASGAGNPEKVRHAAYQRWPLETERAIVLARQYVALSLAGQMDSQRGQAMAEAVLKQALTWRPYDWRLRLERSWLQMAVDPAAALPVALEVIELNPRQTQIPLRYAASFARLHPPAALEVLRQINYERPEDVVKALEIAWSLEKSSELLWEIAPADRVGMQGLEKFAREHGQEKLAAAAAARGR